MTDPTSEPPGEPVDAAVGDVGDRSGGVATAEAGGPAWEHHLPAAGLVVVAVALVALPAATWAGLVAGVAVLQVALVAGWVIAAGLEGLRASLGLGLAAALGADLALLVPHRAHLGALLAVFGIGFLAAVLQQMLRRSREELVASLSGEVLMLCGVAGLAALVLLGRTGADRHVAVTAVLSVGAALVVAHLVDTVLPRPQITPEVPRGLVAPLLGVVAAALVAVLRHGAGTLTDGVSSVLFGTVLGAVAVLVSLAASYVVVDTLATDRPPHRWSLPIVQALLPIAACGPVALALLSIL